MVTSRGKSITFLTLVNFNIVIAFVILEGILRIPRTTHTHSHPDFSKMKIEAQVQHFAYNHTATQKSRAETKPGSSASLTLIFSSPETALSR